MDKDATGSPRQQELRSLQRATQQLQARLRAMIDQARGAHPESSSTAQSDAQAQAALVEARGELQVLREALADSRAGATGDGRAARRLLAPREHLVLQLRALGYSRPQVTQPASLSLAALEASERSACATLGAATVEEAVELAGRYGLRE